ncbi:MAG TPA: metallophosphoesterase [Terracidiphilus sp.]|nr:metallophosphoesterase [Terracidiphilus sp.]
MHTICRKITRIKFPYRTVLAFALAIMVGASVSAQDNEKSARVRPEDLPTSNLLSQSGPAFRVSSHRKHTTIIVFGDQRFTDPSNTTVTDPVARRLLVSKIEDQHPDGILLNGDVPYSGDVVDDYRVYREETKGWRDARLNVFPALGNHEFHGDARVALEHWWSAFPELRNRRWYSAQIGKAIYTISLDSDTSLLVGSDQQRWLDAQLTRLPKSIGFVLISLHHPPVADVQTRINVSHNPRPNEIALRDYLEETAPKLRARIIVCAGHIHNYERFSRGGVVYLVSGGGGASPVPVDRTPGDLYQNTDFPNFHYVKFELDGGSLRGTMIRLDENAEPAQQWQVRDRFTVSRP